MKTQPPFSTNAVWHHATVTRARHEEQNGHRGAIIWFTGLSGVGKSTLAHAVKKVLYQSECRTFVLDGDFVVFWSLVQLMAAYYYRLRNYL